MVSRRTVAIVLVAVGVVVVAGFLAMAIYGEVTRPRGTERIAKLILITAWDRRSADEEAVIIRENYGEFLKLKIDIEMAYTKNGHQKLSALGAGLRLGDADQEVNPANSAESLENDREMFDKLHAWFSAEDTELDKTAETTVKQFNFLSVSGQQLANILGRLGKPSSTPDLVAIEAWPPAEIKIMALKPDRNSLNHIRDSTSFDMLRHDLCPASGADDYECKFERE